MRAPLFVLFSLFAITSFSQIVVTHFNASWNDHNKADWIGNLEGCDITYVDISVSPLICKRNKIKSVPTIIIFNKGVEVYRVQGGLSFRVRKSVEEQLQEVIYRLSPYPPQWKKPVLF